MTCAKRAVLVFSSFMVARASRLHSRKAQARGSRYLIKKSARELRQGGSDYRCCIPALAGFVSPQSIAPDGNEMFPKECACATSFPCFRVRLFWNQGEVVSRLHSSEIGAFGVSLRGLPIEKPSLDSRDVFDFL